MGTPCEPRQAAAPRRAGRAPCVGGRGGPRWTPHRAPSPARERAWPRHLLLTGPRRRPDSWGAWAPESGSCLSAPRSQMLCPPHSSPGKSYGDPRTRTQSPVSRHRCGGLRWGQRWPWGTKRCAHISSNQNNKGEHLPEPPSPAGKVWGRSPGLAGPVVRIPGH